jgi:FtsZ-binding cell division protein ZapB
MDTGLHNLRSLLNDLKNYSFWDRLFRWGRIKSQLIEVSSELQAFVSSLDFARSEATRLQHLIERLNEEKNLLQTEVTALKEKNDSYLKRGQELANERAALMQKQEILEREVRALREEIAQFKAVENKRREEHDRAMANFQKMYEQLSRERNEEKERRHQAEIERLRKMKETWQKHEENVKNRISAICQKHGIEYLDTVPFKGKPDNTLRINDEFIIFDAKSPASDDLSNFPTYLRNQAESLSKYVKEENVRREIFLVVPTNTLESIQHFEYKLSDYTVYVISIDALEPVILALRRIEDYEFAEQLSPEERENICRVIGKFIHLSKRRIQIDGFFARQFFELVYRSEADLPKDFLDKVIAFERAEKINPPIERRARQISIKELEAEIQERKADAEQKGITMDETVLSSGLAQLPLYTTREETGKKVPE